MSQEFGLTPPDDERNWRARWTERLERIDQHLVDLNEALLLLLALDDLTRDVLGDRPATGEPETAPPPPSVQLVGWQQLLEENRTALEGTRRRLETVADRLASLTAEMAAVVSDLRGLASKTGPAPAGSGPKTNIVPIRPHRPADADRPAPMAPPAARAAPGSANSGQGPASRRPAAASANASGSPGGAAQESRAVLRRRRWLW